MKINNYILLAAVLSSTNVLAISAPEISGKFVHETGKFQDSGTSTGNTVAHNKDSFKTESSLKIYVDGEVNDTSSYHLELQGYNNSSAIDGYKSNETGTQRDAFREGYVDTSIGDWQVRAGKQQVVWGTADGAKFLDIINPTDYSEMAQNQMEDSRIPVWMLNAEKIADDGGNFQFIISQPKENYFAGLNRNIDQLQRKNASISGAGPNALSYSGDVISKGHDKGHTFILKGVDTITGEDNGFLNIVPDLGTVAALFGRAFDDLGYSSEGGLNLSSHDNAAMAYFTVGGFNNSTSLKAFSQNYDTNFSSGSKGFADMNFGGTAFWRTDGYGCYQANGTDGGAGVVVAGGTGTAGDACTYRKSSEGTFYSGMAALAGFAGMFGTNLHDLDSSVTNTTFEYMDRTPFATFDAFVNARSQYVFDLPNSDEPDVSLRYKNTTNNGTNYSLNYSYAYDKNPVINVSWRDLNGNKLTVNRLSSAGTAGTYNIGGSNPMKTAVLSLSGGSNSNGYGGLAMASGGEHAILRFTESLERAHNIGGSIDTTIETEDYGPVVIRAEGIFQKDVYQPVMDRGALSIGDLPAALTMRKSDRFKYVIGADITALTNMMVSLQFIQDINLDHIDNNVDFDGTQCSYANTFTYENCGVYTLDFANMHMSNGMQKAEKAKEFVSIYLSKPFGDSGEHRWNNILMLEENGGQWNRLDVEYTIDDNTQATAEFNRYWGNANTQFGQLEKSSNIQLGLKYSF